MKLSGCFQNTSNPAIPAIKIPTDAIEILLATAIKILLATAIKILLATAFKILSFFPALVGVGCRVDDQDTGVDILLHTIPGWCNIVVGVTL